MELGREDAPGVVIGELALVGAGSVVTRDIPDGVLALGTPARVRCRVEQLRCPDGGRAYGRLESGFRRSLLDLWDRSASGEG